MNAEPMYLHYFTSDKTFPFFIQYGHHDSDGKMHYHANFYELMIVLDGTSMQQVNNKTYYIKRGDVFVFGEGVSHNFTDVHDLHICNILFQPSFAFDRYNDLGKLPGYHKLFKIEPYLSQNDKYQHFLKLNFEEFENVKSIITFLYKEYNTMTPGRHTTVTALFQILITYLSRCCNEKTTATNNNAEFKIAQSVSYMEKNFKTDISTKKLAAISFMSERHFMRLFSEVYHITPHRYLINLRLQYACSLLENPHNRLSISDISLESGFQSSNYFSRMFKQTYGISPKDFRVKEQVFLYQ